MKKKDKDLIKSNIEDDNRVIANMNIDGMQMHNRHMNAKPLYDESKQPVQELNKRELRRISLSATLGGLLVGLVFLIVFLLFIMFCVYIWF